MKHRFSRVITVLALMVYSSLSSAQPATYPSNPIRMIVPFGTGGATDILARLLAQKMEEQLKQRIVVENKPGAGGSIGSNDVARAPADGYTLLVGTSSTHGINRWIYKLPYDVEKSFSPITMLATGVYALSVNPTLHPEIKTVADLLKLGRSRIVTYASTGNGTNSHLGAELLSKNSGVSFQHIPYKSQAPAITDLLAGHVDFYIDAISATTTHSKTGAIRVLATTGNTRSPIMKDVPTMIESGVKDYEMTGWFVLLAPSGTPEPIISILNKAALDAIRSPELSAKIRDYGNEPFPSTPKEAQTYMQNQLAHFKQMVDAAGAKVD